MQETDRAFGLSDPSLAAGPSPISFFSSAVPFINVFHQIGELDRNDGAWVIEFVDENGVEQRLDYSQLFRAGFLDENGFVQTLPEGSRTLITLFNDVQAEANTGGRYVFLYEGEGDFEFFGGELIESESTPGRAVIEFTSGNAIGLIINDVNEDNHLRDFALVREEHEPLHEAGALFNPDFIEVIEDYRVLRFMDWMATNNSNVREFDDLATIDNAFFGIPASQTLETDIAGNFPDLISDAELETLPRRFIEPVFLDPDTGLPLRDPITNELLIASSESEAIPDGIPTGVPLEVLVALSNQVGADPWFNIPHQASDDFVRQFAEYVRDNVDPDLQIYIEYSNEVWNSGLDQFHYANEQGLEFFEERRALGDNFGDQFGDFPVSAWYGYRSVEILSIFHEVFGPDQAHRIEGVLGAQTVNSFRTTEIIAGAEYFLELNDPDTRLDDIVDSVGITGYFGGNVTSNSLIGESLVELIALSRQAFENGETSSQYEFFNNELIQYYRDGTLFEGALPGLDGILNFNLEDFRGWIQDQLSIIAGNDFAGNPTRTPYDFDLIQYEGGPHIVPVTNDPDLRDFLRQFNRSEQVALLQREAFELFRNEGGTLANDFHVVGQQSFSNTFGTLAFLGDSNPLADTVFEYNETAAAEFGTLDATRDGTAFQQGITEIGSANNDTIFGTREEDFIAGGDGNDAITAGEGDNGLNGEEGDDTLDAGSGDDTLVGGDGNDSLMSRGGADSLTGGEGDDTIRSGTNLDTVFGGGGNDVIIAQSGSDFLDGGDGNDFISGSAGFDTLIGGDGADTLNGGVGADSIEGGLGDDEIAGASNNDTIFGGAGDDSIQSGSGFDSVDGGIGNDTIIGGAGFDTIFGGGDNDVISGGVGADSLVGGDGNDRIDGGSNLDTILGGAGNDTLTATSGADFIDGGAGADVINGGAGFDTLLGGNSNDTISGGVGRDSIEGNSGNDMLFGGSNFDTIAGGLGDDTLFGNSAGDTFVFADNFGDDVIEDFNIDRTDEFIDLSEVSGITSFADLTANHLSSNGAGDAVITIDGNTITLTGVSVASLSANDFIF